MRAWLRRDLPLGLATMVAVLLTLGSTLLLDPELGPSVLGIALAVSLSRSQLERDLRGRFEAGALLPVLGAATAGIGALLTALPWVGAATFVVGMTASILLRSLGDAWRRVSALVALPFTTLLIAPPADSTRYGPIGHVLVPLAVGVIAWAAVTVVQLLALRLGVIPRAPGAGPAAARPLRRPSSYRPSPTVRFAIQMGAALAAAFVVGYLVFPTRWAWIVLTTLVVTLGSRGRADTLHKAIHRLVGSGIGTVLALLPVAGIARSPAPAVAAALFAVLVGVVLRDRGYLWWALAVTLALAIVQQLAGAPQLLLLQRWEEILIGAVIGVLPAWLLLPVRSADTARARIRDVLAALHEQRTAPSASTAAALDAALRELRRGTAPFAELTRLTRGRIGGTAGWVALTETCAELGRTGGSPAAGRALTDARRALREPAQLAAALTRLRDELVRADPVPADAGRAGSPGSGADRLEAPRPGTLER